MGLSDLITTNGCDFHTVGRAESPLKGVEHIRHIIVLHTVIHSRPVMERVNPTVKFALGQLQSITAKLREYSSQVRITRGIMSQDYFVWCNFNLSPPS